MRKYADVRVWPHTVPPTRDQIIRESRGCQAIVTLLTDQIDRNVIESIEGLKAIVQYAAGVDNIDIQAATEKGIIVTNTPGALTEATADLTWALILAACRRVVEADRAVRSGEWKVAWEPTAFLGTDIHGATLGIVGMGRIGAAVARRSVGFRMKVLYYSRSDTDVSRAIEREVGATRVTLDMLLSNSDIVTVHVPLTPQTRHMIGREQLRMMRPGSVFINTSRGAVVDERALEEALLSGHIGAAGLDVFEKEPIPVNSRLVSMRNVVLLPHIGSATHATRNRMAEMCALNLAAIAEGKTPPNIVNPGTVRGQ